MLASLLSLLLTSAPAPVDAPAPAPAPPVTLEVANRCTGPAQGLPFVTGAKSDDGPVCTLELYTPPPRSPEDSARWGPAIPHIDVDLNDMARDCAEGGYGIEPPSRAPSTTLYIRVQGAERVQIESRPLLGRIEENNFLSDGWGPWTSVYDSPVEAGKVLQVPIADLTSGAITLFELRIRAGDQVQQFGVSFPAVC